MTHDEASQKLQKELGWTKTQADLHVSGSACLGMLKLDEPKSGGDLSDLAFKTIATEFEQWNKVQPTGGINTGFAAATMLQALTKAGLKIVEK